MSKIDGYSLSKAWFNYAKNNASKIKPIHAAIYFWCIQKNNDTNWVKEFQLPTDEACNVLGIAKKDTFLKALKELVEMGIVTILKESKNIYTARYITLYDFKFNHPNNWDGNRVSNGGSNKDATVTNINYINNKPLKHIEEYENINSIKDNSDSKKEKIDLFEGFTEQEKMIWDDFVEWKTKNDFTRVDKMKQPLQPAQLITLIRNKVPSALIKEKYKAMENKGDLHKSYVSAYLTLTAWIKKTTGK